MTNLHFNTLKRHGPGLLLLAVISGLFVMAIPPAQAQMAQEHVFYNFMGYGWQPPDGENPTANLIVDGNGNLYGTTQVGGANNWWGTVFKITPGGQETVLYSFTGGIDGAVPAAGLFRDVQGNLYGTTVSGGAATYGTVYMVTPAGAESVLYSFQGANAGDGKNPWGNLFRDAGGNFYGTTCEGGSTGNGAYPNGYGTIFKLSPNGEGGYNETVLYKFTGTSGKQKDGWCPRGGLIRDANGNFYGTTIAGGNGPCFYGCGTLFEFSRVDAAGNYKEMLLWSFQNAGFDGSTPYGDLVREPSTGKLYGTACQGGHWGSGTVFVYSPWAGVTALHSFGNGADGSCPMAGLIQDANGNLYGTTSAGGAFGLGTVFEFTNPTNPTPPPVEVVLWSFRGAPDGADPEGALLLDSNGTLWGTTFSGGSGLDPQKITCGTIFSIP